MGAISHESQGAIVEQAIRNISHIATLPEVTLKIIELVEDPSSTAQDLHSLISNDPALCSRILKVVNSAFYGLPRQIGSINRAIVLLGLNAVKNIAIAASLTKLFRGGELCAHFSARDLWMHSLGTATASKLICDRLKLGLPDEAFLAGLIHDIGMMVEMQFDRRRLAEVFENLTMRDGAPQCELRDLEQDIFGATHEAFGSGLCETWKFPKSFGYVTGHHHDPFTLPSSSRTLAAVVHVADRIVPETVGGFRHDLTSLEISKDVFDELSLGLDQLEEIKSQLPKAIDEAESTFR